MNFLNKNQFITKFINFIWNFMRVHEIRSLVGAGATESASSALSFAQRWKFLECWVENSLADELSNAVAFGDSELEVRVIEQDNTNVTAIIFVDYSGADVNEVFSG